MKISPFHTQTCIEQQLESFHEAIGPVIFCGQIFGLIPVDNVLQPDVKKLEFRWKSKKTIYSLIFLFFGSVESAVGIRRFVRLGFNIHFTENFLFLITEPRNEKILIISDVLCWQLIWKSAHFSIRSSEWASTWERARHD